MAQSETGHAGPLIGRELRARAGLTLVEVLVVIVIIGILATLTISVASRVSSSGKARMTEDAIRILDQALTSYVAAKETIPSPIIKDPRFSGQRYIPVADARNMSGGRGPREQTIINSGGLFVYQAEQEAGLTGLFAGVDQKMFARFDADTTDPACIDTATGAPNPNINQFAAPGTPGGPSNQVAESDQPWIPSMLDGWGRPIRYVHPMFAGLLHGASRVNPTTPSDSIDTGDDLNFGELIPPGASYSYSKIRRNNRAATTGSGPAAEADSDGGRPTGNRPYFYSAGPDGDPSTIDDNLYNIRPEFAN